MSHESAKLSKTSTRSSCAVAGLMRTTAGGIGSPGSLELGLVDIGW